MNEQKLDRKMSVIRFSENVGIVPSIAQYQGIGAKKRVAHPNTRGELNFRNRKFVIFILAY